MEAVGKVEAAAKSPNTETRRVEKIEVGQAIRQGDIYLTRINDGHPVGKRRKDHQLAPGTSQGSRHIVEGAGVKVFEPGPLRSSLVAPDALLGPIIVAEQAFAVTHPEHAHFDLPPGTYQCTFQKDARTLERVQD